MYNILIVDDDHLFRTYLKKLIDYKKYSCEVYYEADNGQAALEIVKSNLVHIIITDMNMPVMNGVELIEEVKLVNNDIVFIALSGFEDFYYVKESMKNGAIDYLLKHRISEKYLINIILKARRQLESVTKTIENDNDYLYKAYQKELRLEFIKCLILEGSNNKVKANELMINLFGNIEPLGITLLLLEIDDYKYLMKKWENSKQQKRFIDTMLDICQGVIDDIQPGIVVHIENNRIIIVFSVGTNISKSYLLDRTNQIIGRVKNSIKRLLNITCCIAVSTICNDISKLDIFYNETIIKMTSKFYAGNDHVFLEKPLAKKESKQKNNLERDLSTIKYCFSNYQFDKIQEIIENIYNGFLVEMVEQDFVVAISFEFASNAVIIARKYLINIEDLYIDGNIPYLQVQASDTFEQLKNTIYYLYHKLFELIKNRLINPDYSEITKKTLLYFFSNYMNNISLEDVASIIGVNSAYLSRVFKKETGKGFVEYLNLFRVDIAKQLIIDDKVKLKDVVMKTGFTSYNYFFKVFKEVTGYAPQEFRKYH